MRSRRGSRAVFAAAAAVLLAGGLAGCSGPIFDVDGPASDTDLVESVSLTQGDMAAGSTLGLIPGGDLVAGTISLDLCYAQFPSEALRVARNQVVGNRDDQDDVWVSSEAILYASPAEAEQGMSELAKAASGCPDDEVTSATSGATGTWAFQDTPDTGWPPAEGYARQAYAFTVAGADAETTGTATYLQRGRMILALYYPPGATAQVVKNAPDSTRFTEVMTNRLLALPEDALTTTQTDAPRPGGLDA